VPAGVPADAAPVHSVVTAGRGPPAATVAVAAVGLSPAVEHHWAPPPLPGGFGSPMYIGSGPGLPGTVRHVPLTAMASPSRPHGTARIAAEQPSPVTGMARGPTTSPMVMLDRAAPAAPFLYPVRGPAAVGGVGGGVAGGFVPARVGMDAGMAVEDPHTSLGIPSLTTGAEGFKMAAVASVPQANPWGGGHASLATWGNPRDSAAAAGVRAAAAGVSSASHPTAAAAAHGGAVFAPYGLSDADSAAVYAARSAMRVAHMAAAPPLPRHVSPHRIVPPPPGIEPDVGMAAMHHHGRGRPLRPQADVGCCDVMHLACVYTPKHCGVACLWGAQHWVPQGEVPPMSHEDRVRHALVTALQANGGYVHISGCGTARGAVATGRWHGVTISDAPFRRVRVHAASATRWDFDWAWRTRCTRTLPRL
jgi:hypothetical protein